MSSLANQQQNLTYSGLMQIPGGITNTLQQVQDGNGNVTGLSLSSAGASVTTSSTFQASKNGTTLTGALPRLISDGFGDLPTVKDFGAVGNGSTDDTAAFTAAIAASPTGVAVPAGSYKITGTVSGAFYSFGTVTIVTGTVTSIQNVSVPYAASTGSTLVGTIQSGTGAVSTTVATKINQTISVFDFMTSAQIADVQSNTASIDCYGAFQAATNAVQTNSLGGVVYIPVGTYLISGGTITNDRSTNSALGRVSFKGQDENGTRIKYTGSGNNCFYIANNQTAAFEQSASYQRISDMTILGAVGLRLNTAGVTMNLGAFAKFERLNIQGFDFGMYLQDVDQAYFEKINLRFNNKGLFGIKSPTPGVSSTQPNNWTYVSCTISNNGLYGASIIGGAAHTWVGGDVEYNGLSNGVNGWGLAFTDSGYEGGKGCNLHGVYFEGNQGIADLIIAATTVNVTPMLGVVHHVSSEFHRNGLGSNGFNILCAFGADATVGKQSLVLTASSFKSFGAYTPSSLTPNINYSITPADITNFFDLGSYYMNAVEKPAFVQNLNKQDLQVTKTANQTFTTAVQAQWLIDTVINPNPLWAPTLSSGQVVINYTGTYSINFIASLSTSTAGAKNIAIFKNGVLIGYGEASIALNVISASSIARFTAGDILTVKYTQSTGANQDIVGGSTANSVISIVKVF